MALTSKTLFIRSEFVIESAVNIKFGKSFHVSNLTRILRYVETKEDFPMVSYDTWRHIICSKMLLKEPVAKLLYENCCLVCGLIVSATTQVNIKALLIVTYVHNLQSSRGNWQKKTVYHEPALPFMNLVGRKSSEEHSLISTLLMSLEELFAFIEVESAVKNGFLLAGTLETFNILLESYSSKTIITFSNFVKNSLCCKGNKYVLQDVLRLVHKTLGENPFSIAECLRSGLCVQFKHRAVSLSQQSKKKEINIITNIENAPADHKTFVFRELSKQALAVSCNMLESANVYIGNCKNITLYLVSPVKTVIVENCQRCRFVLGTVAKSLTVMNSNRLNIHAVSCRVVIVKCVDSNFYLHTQLRPLLVGPENTNIHLAPFNTFYDALQDHMKACNLRKDVNEWNNPLCVSDEFFLGNPSPDLLLQISEFSILKLSLQGERCINEYAKIPGLPDEFLSDVTKKMQNTELWKTMKNHSLDKKEDRVSYNIIVQKKFQQWLLENGYRCELSAWKKFMSSM